MQEMPLDHTFRLSFSTVKIQLIDFESLRNLQRAKPSLPLQLADGQGGGLGYQAYFGSKTTCKL